MELKEYKERLNLEKETERKEAVDKFLSLMIDMRIDLSEVEKVIITRDWKLLRAIACYNYDGSIEEIKTTKGEEEDIIECEYSKRNELKRLLRVEKNSKYIETIGVTIEYGKDYKTFSAKEKWVIDCTNIK